METFLNGERAMDLGDLMEYRKMQAFPPLLQQKLNKIEFSALRAACRHMLHLNPTERLSARDYLTRLEGHGGGDAARTELIPSSFKILSRLIGEVSSSNENRKEFVVMTPDARMARAAAYYGQIVWETVGVHDKQGIAYFKRVLGKTTISTSKLDGPAQQTEEAGKETCDQKTSVVDDEEKKRQRTRYFRRDGSVATETRSAQFRRGRNHSDRQYLASTQTERNRKKLLLMTNTMTPQDRQCQKILF